MLQDIVPSGVAAQKKDSIDVGRFSVLWLRGLNKSPSLAQQHLFGISNGKVNKVNRILKKKKINISACSGCVLYNFCYETFVARPYVRA